MEELSLSSILVKLAMTSDLDSSFARKLENKNTNTSIAQENIPWHDTSLKLQKACNT